MKKKDIRDLNSQNKEEIMQKLIAMGVTCRENEITERLTKLRVALSAQNESDSDELFDIDEGIKTVLSDLSKDIASQASSTAMARLDKVSQLVADRAEYCPENALTKTKADEARAKRTEKARTKLKKRREKELARRKKRGLPVADLYTPEELLKNMLRAAIDEKIRLENEAKGYHDKLIANPNDQFALSMWKPTQIKITAAQKLIETYSNETERSALIMSVSMLDGKQKELLAGRSVSSADFELIMQKFNALEETRKQDQSATQAASAAFMGSAQAGAANESAASVGASFGASVGSSVGASAGVSAGAFGQTNESAASSIFDDPAFRALGSAPTKEDQDLKAVYEQIDGIISTLQKGKESMSREIEKLDERRAECVERLKELLIQRKTADASQCIVLDGRIDELNATLQDVEFSINRFTQQRATLVEQQSLANKLKANKQIAQMDEQISALTGGKLSNLGSLAMSVSEAVERANDALEEAGTANMVAGSVEMNTHTMTGTSARMVDGEATKDEEKYSALESKIGLR